MDGNSAVPPRSRAARRDIMRSPAALKYRAIRMSPEWRWWWRFRTAFLFAMQPAIRALTASFGDWRWSDDDWRWIDDTLNEEAK